MSNIRHSTDGRSNVENPISEEGRFECRIFDIRLSGRSNRKNPIQQIRRIEFATFDPTKCTRLILTAHDENAPANSSQIPFPLNATKISASFLWTHSQFHRFLRSRLILANPNVRHYLSLPDLLYVIWTTCG